MELERVFQIMPQITNASGILTGIKKNHSFSGGWYNFIKKKKKVTKKPRFLLRTNLLFCFSRESEKLPEAPKRKLHLAPNQK